MSRRDRLHRDAGELALSAPVN